MPTYTYQCKECGHELDALQKITADPLKQCPSCNKEALQRGVGGGIGLSFQGSGFYITDYGKGEASCTSNESSSCPCSTSSED